jgi:hypothetical protein
MRPHSRLRRESHVQRGRLGLSVYFSCFGFLFVYLFRFFFVFFVVSISKGGIVCTEWKKASSGTTSLKISDRIPKFTVMDTRGLREILKV